MNRHEVARSWSLGHEAKNSTESFWTDGKYLYSYALRIGVNALGRTALFEYTAQGRYISVTTSCHIGIARPYADYTVSPSVEKYLEKLKRELPEYSPELEMAAIAILSLLGKEGAFEDCISCSKADLKYILREAVHHTQFPNLLRFFISEFGADVLHVLDRFSTAKKTLLAAVV